jgi:hypothetical protein
LQRSGIERHAAPREQVDVPERYRGGVRRDDGLQYRRRRVAPARVADAGKVAVGFEVPT